MIVYCSPRLCGVALSAGRDHAALLFEFVEPLLESTEGPDDMAMITNVFTAPRPRGVAPLDPAQVLSFLRSGGTADKSAGGRSWDGAAYGVKYLEFLIYEQGDTSQERHDELLQLYLNRTQALLKAHRDGLSPASSSRAASSHRDSSSRRSKRSSGKHKTSPVVRSATVSLCSLTSLVVC